MADVPATPRTIDGRYYDGVTAQVRRVRVVATPGELILRDAAGNDLVARWPIVELRVIGDSEHEAVPLLTRVGGEARLAIEDVEARTLLAQSVPEIAPLAAPRPSTAGRILQFGTALCLAVGLVWGGFEVGSEALAPLVPYGLQAKLGEEVYGELVGNRRTCKGREGLAALQGFATRLAAEGGFDHPIRVRVVSGGPVNAYTLPGGILVIYSALIDLATDGDELGGVIAHEIGHTVHYHPTQALARQFGLDQILKATTGGYSEVGTVASSGSLLLAMRNGRSYEREADATGVDLLEKLGLRADGMARFFGELLKKGPDMAKTAGIWSDHPPTQERIDATRRPATGAPDFSEADWKAIRSMCQ